MRVVILLRSLGDVACSPPRELDLVSWNICTSCLSVDTFDLVAISKVPQTNTLRLVVSEVALEAATIWVDPFTRDKLTILESSDVLLARLEVNVSSLSVLLSVCPVSRVDVLVGVCHHALSVSLTFHPVAVVLANLRVHLFANTVLLVVHPSALVLNGLLLWVSSNIRVITLAVAFLYQSSKLMSGCSFFALQLQKCCFLMI